MTGWITRHGTRAFALTLALAATGLPALAQDAPWEAAIARLDFPTALDALDAAIAADPAAPGPRLARAELHRKVARPALALDDLTALLDADPSHPGALHARAVVLAEQTAWPQALADLDTLLDIAPQDVAALTLRATVHAQTGRAAAALADYEAALALAPDDTALAAARDALVGAQAELRASDIRFSPDAVMTAEFVVTEGVETAPNRLYFVHAAPDLAEDYANLDPARLADAVEAGALNIVHLFTYTGADGSIWGNLALICGGVEGFASTHAALASDAGRAALAASDAGDLAPLETLLSASYQGAGLDPGTVRSCALSRSRAARYLADWTAHRDAGAWRGINLLDHWPAFVLNGTPIGPASLAARLDEIAPAPDEAPDLAPNLASATAAGPDAAAPDTGAALDDGPAEADTGDVAAADSLPEAPPAPPVREQPRRLDPAELFPPRPQPADGARVPVALRGIYAPTLAACLAYLDAVETPTQIDAVLPDLNPLDGPVLGTILITSRRAYLVNPLGTECAISGADGSGDAWQAAFACASPLAPDSQPSLQIAPAEADGAPRIAARFADGAPAILRQCRSLGQLGQSVAPLWALDSAACATTAPAASGGFVFSTDGAGNLILRVTPAALPANAGASRLYAAIDNARLDVPGGRWDGAGWQIALGPFDGAAEKLGWGMFLDTRAQGAAFDARLPLLGSSAAMAALADCASGE